MKIAVRLLPVILLVMATSVFAGIKDSKHDLRPLSSDTGQDITTGMTEICKPCHVPHNATNASGGLLWNHAYTAETFTFYDGTTGTMTGESKLCLGCHDGVTGIDNYGGSSNTTTAMSASYAIVGTDLQDDHPVGISYPANGTAGFNDADDVRTALLKLPGTGTGNVECTSCHNPHDNTTGSGKFQRISNDVSAMCLVCHNK